jgi:hypothetical protein
MINKKSLEFSRKQIVQGLAKIYDVRGLDFVIGGFHIIFYRQLPDNFSLALKTVGIDLSEFCYYDEDRGDQYYYYYHSAGGL